MNYEQALEQLGLNPDIRLRQMFELGRLAAPVQQKPLFADIIAKHPGLAEELKAAQPAPVISAGPVTPEMANWSALHKAELTAVMTSHLTLTPAQPAPVQPVAWWVTQKDMDGKIVSFAVTSDYDYAKSVCDLDIATPRPLVFGDGTPPTQPAVPDAITDNSESPEYKSGWNECRELTIKMRTP